jgi:hypothetical protein
MKHHCTAALNSGPSSSRMLCDHLFAAMRSNARFASTLSVAGYFRRSGWSSSLFPKHNSRSKIPRLRKLQSLVAIEALDTPCEENPWRMNGSAKGTFLWSPSPKNSTDSLVSPVRSQGVFWSCAIEHASRSAMEYLSHLVLCSRRLVNCDKITPSVSPEDGLGYAQIAFEVRGENEVESQPALCDGFFSLLQRM